MDMNLDEKIKHYIGKNIDEFYVDKNNFILNLYTGEIILINPIDNRLVKPSTRSHEIVLKKIQKDIETLVELNAVEKESLTRFKNHYKEAL